MDDPSAAAGSPGERRYANHLRIGFNQLEFLLDFAQAFDAQGEAVHTRLVAAPAHVRQFVLLLQACLDDYERRFGPLVAPLDD